MDIIEKLHAIEVDDETISALTEKCQENGWLKHGGYDWQDDPYLEEYPYEFAQLEDIEELREFFMCGNWAIRQGVVYDDLAFIQQVNGGDEWWTLKHTDEGWHAFESWSFLNAAQDPTSFSRAIMSMQMAHPTQCKRLEYMLPDDDQSLVWEASRTETQDWQGQMRECRSFRASSEAGLNVSIYERPSFDGYTLQVFDTNEKLGHPIRQDIESALDAARYAERLIATHIDEDADLDTLIKSTPFSHIAFSLPNEWAWTERKDGSSSLYAPDGTCVCDYDKESFDFKDVQGHFNLREEFSRAAIEAEVTRIIERDPNFHAKGLSQRCEASRSASRELEQAENTIAKSQQR